VSAPVEVGQVLGGKYRVERIIGEGGMGVVVAARHLVLGELVALKFLRADGDASEENIARFRREARAAVRLRSTHVAKVFDVAELEDGTPYIVMEHLVGRDLAQLVEEDGPLPVEQAVDYLTQACEAICEAHARGIIHRDLKPANLFLCTTATGTPNVKVLDFGASRAVVHAGGKADGVKTEGIIGSQFYMSPEQLGGEPIDVRADVWALGATLYEILTGKVPFEGKNLVQQYNLVKSTKPPAPSKLRPEIPAQLDAVVLKALAADKDKRFAGVPAFAKALTPFAPAHRHASIDRIQNAGESITIPAARPSRPPPGGESKTLPAPVAVADTLQATETAAGKKKGARGRISYGVATLVAVAALAAVTVAVRAPRQEEPQPGPASPPATQPPPSPPPFAPPVEAPTAALPSSVAGAEPAADAGKKRNIAGSTTAPAPTTPHANPGTPQQPATAAPPVSVAPPPQPATASPPPPPKPPPEDTPDAGLDIRK
jgi:eukaryotic-like serine/threonine-protein kinase